MELLQLKYFKTVAEVGKISAAAEALILSPPALSASIARLEKELGMKLFDRSSNRISLNRQGQIFLRYVNQVFATLDCAQVELRQSLASLVQPVGVATFLSNLWVDLMTEFYQAYPDITLSSAVLRPEQLGPGGLPPQYTFLLAEESELSSHTAQQMESIALFKDQPAIMVHPSHPLAREDSVSMTQLTGENLFLPVYNTAFRARLDRLFEAKGLPVPAGTENPYMVYYHMVEQGLGISFTSTYTCQAELPGLRCIPIRDFGDCWTMRLFWRRNRALTDNEQTFLSFTRDFFRKS